MTEAEWLVGTDPRPLLDELPGRRSSRKLRLLVCACCRRVWELLTDLRSQQAVELAERYADGLAKRATLVAGQRGAHAAYQRARTARGPHAFRQFGAAHLALQATALRVRFDPRDHEFLRGAKQRKEKTERTARSHLIRDLFGNPFHPVSIAPSWLAWHNAAIPTIAQTIYEVRDLPSGHLDHCRLRILADALEEAGCDNRDILGHCRSGGVHVRGCWVVDVLLGKE
jgi:hypothetical protein